MKYAIVLVLLVAGCDKHHKQCPTPDGGTILQTPCAGQPDGAECCFGDKPSTCRSNECVAP